jgi:hypothetical protein
VYYNNVQLWKGLRKYISNSDRLKAIDTLFTLTVLFKCILCNDILDDVYMGRYKKGQVIWAVLFDQISYYPSLSHPFKLNNRHSGKPFLIELHMAVEGSEHVIGW